MLCNPRWPLPSLADLLWPAALLPSLQGCTPEPRTYNTIISACAKAGQPDAARGVYERMLADGVQVGARRSMPGPTHAGGATRPSCVWHQRRG